MHTAPLVHHKLDLQLWQHQGNSMDLIDLWLDILCQHRSHYLILRRLTLLHSRIQKLWMFTGSLVSFASLAERASVLDLHHAPVAKARTCPDSPQTLAFQIPFLKYWSMVLKFLLRLTLWQDHMNQISIDLDLQQHIIASFQAPLKWFLWSLYAVYDGNLPYVSIGCTWQLVEISFEEYTKCAGMACYHRSDLQLAVGSAEFCWRTRDKNLLTQRSDSTGHTTSKRIFQLWIQTLTGTSCTHDARRSLLACMRKGVLSSKLTCGKPSLSKDCWAQFSPCWTMFTSMISFEKGQVAPTSPRCSSLDIWGKSA